MSLATRLSAFFVVALALVLVGFSGALYVLARTYLVGQLDERLQHALATLEASVDIEPGGLEWEPADRQMTLGVETGPDAVRWVVRDDRGVLVDRSANAARADFPRDWMPAAWPAKPVDGTVFGTAPGWRLAARRLPLDDLLKQGRGHPDDEPGYEVQYRVLVLVAGLSPIPVEATLGRLGLTLSLLSLVVWSASVAAGRWLCLRALTPVARMATAATAMTAADLGQRLPIAGTGDELDELGRAFNDLLDRRHEAFVRLQAAYDGQRRFAGDASHQLRTPLAALLGQVQVARRRERPPEEYRRVLDRVLDEGLRLRGIVESLLFLADPQRSPVELAPAELGPWLEEQVGRWSEHPRASDLRVEIRGDGPLAARVNTMLLGQLVDNLLDNAFKYSPAGTPVNVGCRSEVGSIVLSVEDCGCGLSAEEASRVFEPFYRTDRSRRDGRPGVGLGLSVARRIAAAFGGSLDVMSEPGGGCIFVVRLPAEAVASDQAAMAAATLGP